jgi:hypothetical protein
MFLTLLFTILWLRTTPAIASSRPDQPGPKNTLSTHRPRGDAGLLRVNRDWGGASCRSSNVRNARLATVGSKKAACRDGPIASLRTAENGKPFLPFAMRYNRSISSPPAEGAIDNADPCNYSRQKMQRVPARPPRFSFRLSWDAAGNQHSDLRSIDRLPPLLHPSTYSRCCG